jgi:cyclohexanecarboxylate-CoA ligase
MHMVEAMAAALESAGLAEGDVVSFQLPNCLEAVVIHLACVRIGLVVNPVIPIYRGRELAYILKDADTRLLVIPGTYRGFDYPAMVRSLAVAPPLVWMCDGAASGATGVHAILERYRGATPRGRPADPDALSYLLYTSGTESAPKGVEHTQNTLLFDLLQTVAQNRISADDVIFAPSPVTHITGLLYALLLPFIHGNRLCLLDRWNPGAAARMIAAERCTWTAGATPFLRDLLYEADAQAQDLTSLRTFRCGGADVPPQVIREAHRRGIAAYRSYGCTEHPTISGVLESDPERSVSTDGLLHPHVELRCTDPEQPGRIVAPGEAGELWTRGPDQSPGYHLAELNQAAFDADGWFRTGDLGMLDADGYLTITGRSKDIIIRKGENISAREIENILAEHPLIVDVAVIGLPDIERGERVCAVIVPRAGASISFAEMVGALEAAGIARQKIPEQLEIRDALPTTASGKVRKVALRDELSRRETPSSPASAV